VRQVHEFEMGAIPPYSFELTVSKPAGWWWATPDEIYEKDTLRTATRFRGKLIGVKFWNLGTLNKPRIGCSIYTDSGLTLDEKQIIDGMMRRSLRTGEDLRPFYDMAGRDNILAPVVRDLRGMRILWWPDLFPALILAVTLQMAPMKRSNQMMDSVRELYGDDAEFDGRRVRYWPSPKRIASTPVVELMSRAKLGYRAKNLVSIAESIEAGFPDMDELSRLTAEEARERLMELRGVGPYSAAIVVSERGFSVDVWSAKIFSVLLKGVEPEDPRGVIPEIQRLAAERWGQWTGHAFVYILNDLEKISKRIGIDLTKY
jgi:3-methyladenine DNA glycosylase/8-oxoguanine DNA glycosylase